MSKGKREATGGGWHTGGNPFGEGKHSGKTQPAESETVRRKKVVKIVLCCLIAVMLAVAGVIKFFVVAPDVSENGKPGVQQETSKPELGTQQKGETPTQQEDEVEGTPGRKEDYFTFLLMGKDTSSGSTDTIILVSYDVTAGKVNCMSIPRDTMVNVSWDIKKINSVYSMNGGDEKGMDALKEQVGHLTGIVPDFYVVIEWKAVGRLVEALDGVWFDVPYNMNYDDPYQDLYIHQEKGYRLLDGDDAMQVVRWRKNNDGTNYGDTVRMQVQQDFLKAVAAQCLQLKNWTKISEFANIFFENVETDIKLNNLLWFAKQAMGVNMDNVSFMTVPGDDMGWAWSRTYKNNQSYFFAYPDEVVETVNQHFNPYLQDITEDDLQIMYKNKNGSLAVTNGTLADAKAASAPVKSSGNSGSSSSSSANSSGKDQSSESADGEESTEGTDETVGGDSGSQSGTTPDQSEGTGGETESGTVPVEPENTTDASGGTVEEPNVPTEPETSGDSSTDEDDNQMPAWLLPR